MPDQMQIDKIKRFDSDLKSLAFLNPKHITQGERCNMKMTLIDWCNSKPKVKYSDLNYAEKVLTARNASESFIYDISDGHLLERANDEWYGKLLYLLRDLGYDTSDLEDIDWNRISDKSQRMYEICCELYKYENLHAFPYFIEQIVLDV